MELNQLTEIYEAYIRKAEKVLSDSSAFAGVWGWGDDPKRHPCHMEFYETVEAFVDAFLKAQPSEEAVYQVADWIIRTPADYKDHSVFWYMYAAHGLCKPMIPLLSPAHCAALRDFYDGHYPKIDRLPVQRDLYKSLKKRAKA